MLFIIRCLYRYLATAMAFLYPWPLGSHASVNTNVYWPFSNFKITLPKAVKEKHQQPDFKLHSYTILNGFPLDPRPEWDSPHYHQVSDYLNIRSILILDKCMARYTPCMWG